MTFDSITCKEQCLAKENFIKVSLENKWHRGITIAEKEVTFQYSKLNESRPARKPTVWPLRNVSTQISLRIPRRLVRGDTFRHSGIELKNYDS